jgi:pyrroloquinoline quinone (PQQ) biosynthesis protein C
MATAVQSSDGSDIVARITAIRDKWHTKQHPMFRALAAGELNLRVHGIYMAQHAKYVRYGLEAFGHIYARGPGDVRKMMVANMAEEEGLIGGNTEHGAHDHMQMIYDFCDAAGMTRDEVLNVEVVIPALEKHYGHKKNDRAVVFFAEHELADVEHSSHQMALATKYLDTPELQARAEIVAEEMCRLRWGCTSDTYRMEHLGQWDEMPPGVD